MTPQMLDARMPCAVPVAARFSFSCHRAFPTAFAPAVCRIGGTQQPLLSFRRLLVPSRMVFCLRSELLLLQQRPRFTPT